MADSNFVVKNTLVVNTAFSVNSTALYFSNSFVINATSYVGQSATTLLANNSINLGGAPSTAYVNTSGSYTLAGVQTFNANVAFGSRIIANNTPGNSGQALYTSGSGVYWANVTSIAGTNTQIQFNDSGFANGVSGLTFNKVTGALSVASTINIGTGSISGTNYSGTALNANNLGGVDGVLYARLASPTFTGTIGLPTSGGTNEIKAGTGDGASFAAYNLTIRSHWGIGFRDFLDNNTVKAYIDCRTGAIGLSGGLGVGQAAPANNGEIRATNIITTSSTITNGTITNGTITSLGVGTSSSGTTGEIRATNNITAYFSSDRKFKTNINNIENALNKVNSINGVNFHWTDEWIASAGGEDGYFVRKEDVGVIAQELQEVLPEAVAKREDGSLAVKYERIVPLLIEAIKELSAEIKILKKG